MQTFDRCKLSKVARELLKNFESVKNEHGLDDSELVQAIAASLAALPPEGRILFLECYYQIDDEMHPHRPQEVRFN